MHGRHRALDQDEGRELKMAVYGQNLYRRNKGGGGTMNLPSLVDVVFLLLIFFMLTTTFSQVLTKLDIELPRAKAVTEQKKQNVIIEIGLEGKLAFNGEDVSLEELDKELGDVAMENPNEVIIIKADKGVAYGEVVKVMGICKSHKLNRLAMAALAEDA